VWHAAVLSAYSKISVPSAAQVEDGNLGIMTNAALWMRRLLCVEPMSVHSYVHPPSAPYSVTGCLDVTQAMESGPSAIAAAVSKMYRGGQVAWPTPTAAVWGNIRTIANRVLITLEWLVAYLQENPGEAERAATLFALLLQICHQLLAGHVLDCKLDITELLQCGAIPLLSAFFDVEMLTRPQSHKDQHTCILLEEMVSLFLKRMATDQGWLGKELDYTAEGWVVAIVEWIAHGFGKLQPQLYTCDRTLMH